MSPLERFTALRLQQKKHKKTKKLRAFKAAAAKNLSNQAKERLIYAPSVDANGNQTLIGLKNPK